ncbi:MAG: beta-propeller domain-containing protein [Deltaproteobacteria bacterium]|jgi:hypothetical protein|nr:beta-propeller domain-containing protein [Deltaproteobacteria bacterium]MBW2530584.1 beta-propeller domain-containing protein [Deltaproteobacteria bacterium]
MGRCQIVFLAVVLLGACRGPSRSEVAKPELPPLGAGADAGPEPDVAAKPDAEAPQTTKPAIEVSELPRTPAPTGNLVEAADAARLVPVPGGIHAHAGRIVAKVRRAWRRRQMRARLRAPLPSKAAAPPSEAPAPAAEPAADESVTNTQVAGVDEGGIVKAWGEYLVVLRRGRLFTVRLGDQPGAAQPISAISARPPQSSHDSWYDEMLVHPATGTVAVIGFSYDHGATEVGLFRIGADGALSHRQTHLLRSNDYYSSRNYASRLVGDKLIFYMPHYLVDTESELPQVSLPSARPFAGGGWRSIVRSAEVFSIAGQRNTATLHTVVTCDLAAPRLRCEARGILGDEGRTFYVSREAVYVWVMPGWSDWDDGEEMDESYDPSQLPSHLYRLPLDGSRPSALVVRGSPVDQFSFHETADDLWVLVQAEGSGDAMWAPELTAGAVGLVRVPLSAFGRNVRVLSRPAYLTLPTPGGAHGHGAMQNRFVGDYLLYGAGTSWGRAGSGTGGANQLVLHRYAEARTFTVTLPSGVDRIEAMAGDAVVVGGDGTSLHFHALELGAIPTPGGHYARKGATQGETRSHGFFYKPSGERRGVLGLPTRSAAQPGAAQLVHGSAEVLYLAVNRLDFSPLGALRSSRQPQNDHCEVSCVDWYGNARPLFYRGRVFALLGYELVEGRIAGGTITEIARSTLLSALRQAGGGRR